MNLSRMKAAIEAVLFSSGEAVEADRLAGALDADRETLTKAVQALQADLQGRGVKIIEVEDSYQMCSRAEYYEYIRKATERIPPQKLSQAALETLSIVAYNQPITRSSIDFVRGVDSSYSVTRLVERGLIEEVGRMDAPGRPMLYATTRNFLRCFGLSSLDQLPELKAEGEDEAE